MRVLVIEDEGALREQLVKSLRQAGYAVDATDQGEEGAFMGTEYPVDVAVLDLGLPDMDGLEVLSELRSRRPDLPVVVISGHGTIATAVEATKLGAFDFMEKPLEREQVLLKLRNALERGRLERTVREYRLSFEERYRLVEPMRTEETHRRRGFARDTGLGWT